MLWLILICMLLGYIIATRNEIISYLKMKWDKFKQC
jgi:hypothetical protein